MLFNRLLPTPARPSSITTLDGSDLEHVDNYKYLGVWLECKLSFQTHIKHLQSKIKSRIGFLFRNKASFTHAAKHTPVKLTILSIIDFGDVIHKIASNTTPQIGCSRSQCHPFCHQSPVYYPLDPVEGEVVVLTPHGQVSDLLPIGGLIVVCDQAYHCWVISQCNGGAGVVPGSAVKSEQGVQGLSTHP